ncbi:selenoprotein K, partial [Sigmodon hispidus]
AHLTEDFHIHYNLTAWDTGEKYPDEQTLLQQDVKKRRGYGSSSDSRYDDGRGSPGNPPRRMG